MDLFRVEWYYDKHTISREYVWADSMKEAQEFGEYQARKNKKLLTRVEHVFAAATTETKPTPLGLDTYKVVRGDKL